MKTKLLPAQARRKWKSSTVPNPCAVIRQICKRSPALTNKALIERCVKAGVSPRTAAVRVCRFKKEYNQNKK